MNEIELVEVLNAIHRKIMKRLSGYAQKEGLSIPEAMVLWRVHKNAPIRVSDLADQIGLPTSTLSGMLDRLVAGGWLGREADPNDRRAVLMHSTDKLTRYTENSKRASAQDLEKSFRTLAPELIARLTEDLGDVLACLERDEEHPH